MLQKEIETIIINASMTICGIPFSKVIELEIHHIPTILTYELPAASMYNSFSPSYSSDARVFN